MNTVLIILGIFFSLVATIIGIFITPFLSWLTNFEMYIVILVIGAILLLISILLPIIKRKAKWAVAILVAIPIFISGLVSTIKFGGSILAKDDYLINYYDGVYNMFGIKIIEDRGRTLIAYNKYGEKFIICWDYREVEGGKFNEPRLDSDGRRVYNNNGYAVYDECTNYKIHGQIRIYNSDGILLEKKNPHLFSYYRNEESAYGYEYQYSGVDAKYVGGQYFVNGERYGIRSIAEAEVINWIEINRDYIVQE